MMRTAWASLAVVFLAVPLAAQNPPPSGMQRRAQLEQQLLQRFVQRASTEMALSQESRPRLGQVVHEIARERRVLNQEGMMLRRRIVQTLQDPAAGDAQFEPLLEEQRRLRQREHELWQREQARLEGILTPRQRAQFALLWQRLQDDARNIMMQRPPGPPGGRQPGGL